MTRTYLSKSFKTLSILALLLAGQSCKDLLDEKVISSIPDDYIATTAGFNSASNAAYSSLRNFYGTERGLSMTEYGTDLYSAGADGSFKGFHFMIPSSLVPSALSRRFGKNFTRGSIPATLLSNVLRP